MIEKDSILKLIQIKKKIESLLNQSKQSLKEYWLDDKKGFSRIKDSQRKFSSVSTATVVDFLLDSGNEKGFYEHDTDWQKLSECLLKMENMKSSNIVNVYDEWIEAGTNPYTYSYVLNALNSIKVKYHIGQANEFSFEEHKKKLKNFIEELHKNNDSSRFIFDGISPYITYLYFKPFNSKDEFEWIDKYRGNILSEMESEIRKYKSSEEYDLYNLAYSLIFYINVIQSKDDSKEKEILHGAADVIIDTITSRKKFPRSAAQMALKKGFIYCYGYEMIVDFVEVVRKFRQSFLPLNFVESLVCMTEREAEINNTLCWCSGHNNPTPESWATASVFNCLKSCHDIVLDHLRRASFEYIGDTYYTPCLDKKEDIDVIMENFLDSKMKKNGRDISLKKTLKFCILDKLSKSVDKVTYTQGLPKEVPISLLLFGPPGTAKTTSAKNIAKAAGWPLLQIDPSHFTKNGINNALSEANFIFDLLENNDKLVVLLDEIDELVRERSGEKESLSRFFTTAMLPKLMKIRESRKIVLIVATNFVNNFDSAIKRRGRFDAILQIMPPLGSEKIAKRGWEDLVVLGSQILEDLTYDECEEVVNLVKQRGCKPIEAYAEVADSSTMSREIGSETWKRKCQKETEEIRLPTTVSLESIVLDENVKAIESSHTKESKDAPQRDPRVEGK